MTYQYHPAQEFEYNQITNNIYVGTNLCCQVHYEKKLLENGVTADISLEIEHVDAPYGAEYFIWIPVVDFTPPTMQQFNFGVAVIEQLIAQDKKIYIHCKEGHGRAPTLAAAYFIKQGFSVNDAVKKIQKERSEAHPNRKQIAALVEYSKSIKA